jgi:hypothetical protein
VNRLTAEESGFAAIEWALGIGLIVLPLMIAVMSIAPVLDRQSTARTIAQEAARTMVLADDWDSGEAAALDLARRIARNHGIDDAEWCPGVPEDGCLSIEIGGTTPGLLARGEEVSITVRMPVAALTVPFIGDFAALTSTGTHAERVDDYRSFAAVTP